MNLQIVYQRAKGWKEGLKSPPFLKGGDPFSKKTILDEPKRLQNPVLK
jgi:hypothetical protein